MRGIITQHCAWCLLASGVLLKYNDDRFVSSPTESLIRMDTAHLFAVFFALSIEHEQLMGRSGRVPSWDRLPANLISWDRQ
jgi:hypothetical protein